MTELPFEIGAHVRVVGNDEVGRVWKVEHEFDSVGADGTIVSSVVVQVRYEPGIYSWSPPDELEAVEESADAKRIRITGRIETYRDLFLGRMYRITVYRDEPYTWNADDVEDLVLWALKRLDEGWSLDPIEEES